ncbi:hypothetical protein BJ085DRAFT_15915 [Dimargaris cristalligena]|uniref:Uncharacterized protein n=1 Tax=Dimargaris cristalligena TaxID=215637 RepID=A0A4P9ZZI3_9FUNG|nr:hypothetical protein BJ085DRAFT_15915 [Dimargaris cristalligena]|eukprot:RKP38521.1 hypothetical protein BJ085DRAFT_15915 [Dimargaris cristalligena]
MWSQEFAKGLESQWAEEFDGKAAPGESADQSNWANQFAGDEEFRELEEAFSNSRSMEDWVHEYRKNTAHLSNEPSDLEWDAMAKAWTEHGQEASSSAGRGATEVGSGYRADPEAYQNYDFHDADVNPYLRASAPSLTDEQIRQLDLSEAVLALEARVQRNPQDARAWYQLGVRQQENEQDGLAIASLRKAVELNPTELNNAWIDLAVSFTNENCRVDAYDALQSWIETHPEYRQFLNNNDGSSRHQSIENVFLEAARHSSASHRDADAEVQIALGVLFHIAEDYDKATDCFQTALNLRPQEYMLWNKLGATLANARQPQRAMDAYFTALELNPSYIRARYNLAISSINLGLHREAAEHLLGALALQTRATKGGEGELDGKGKEPAVSGGGGLLHNRISSNLWNTLKMTMQILDQPDLINACDHQDLDAFQGKFDF